MKSKLPDSQLVEILRKKSAERNEVEFDYIKHLEELRHRVGGEVRFINQLFPEYTPHDEEYHLSRLFHVADTLIGPDRYESMNATELFVLGCGLYGHDWGMAVNEVEREYIVTSKVRDGFLSSDFALLHDEHRTFESFVKDRGLAIDEVRTNGIANDDWREYVRRTHAWRSGERIRHYFQHIDSGVGEAGGRVCEGHWLDIEVLQDFHRYPINFAVLRENVNLAALAVYVRLIDLLDIGHDRTPYVIWKFVAPRDRKSKMEWNKHRALQPITCPPYLNGRIVLVDGSTDDHEVYAALEDLRDYCQQQLRECMDLVAQLGDPRHLLDIYHLQWRVVPRGFDPVLVRFEFDRDRVFEILSDEIYQGDPYVFLRELLQNSIDAIRMRRELLERHARISVGTFGLIRVDVDHQPDGDATITWNDDGVGMDAYILRNYLAVAGKSYYCSEEFERQGLSLDPISKFGIGILSCFIVADTIEIETCKDPYAGSSSESLRIKIPSLTRQFRVEKSSPFDFGIGTRITVHVNGNRLPKDTESLDVTRYLKAVAGFVEFPILVFEKGRSTVILHPKTDINPRTDPRLQQYTAIEEYRTSLAYPIEQVILAQTLETARLELTEVAFDLKADLGLFGFEGVISYLLPSGEYKWISTFYEHSEDSGLELYPIEGEKKNVRWKSEWGVQYSRGLSEPARVSRSANARINCQVFRDGVLIPGAELPEDFQRVLSRPHFPLPKLVINLLGKKDADLDIARSQIRTSGEHWFEPINNSLMAKLRQEFISQTTHLAVKDVVLTLGLFFEAYRLRLKFLDSLKRSEIPVMTLNHEGRLEVVTWDCFEGNAIRVTPKILSRELGKLVNSYYLRNEYDGYLSQWQGDTAVISSSSLPEIRVEAVQWITDSLLETSCFPNEVVLLRPPGEDLPFLVQEVWHYRDRTLESSLKSIAERVVKNPLEVMPQERHVLLGKTTYWGEKFLEFPPAATAFKVGRELYNLRHPLAELLLRAIAWIFLNKEAGNEDEIRVGRLKDAISPFRAYYSFNAEELKRSSEALLEAAKNVGLTTHSSLIEVRREDVWYDDEHKFNLVARRWERPFGESL